MDVWLLAGPRGRRTCISTLTNTAWPTFFVQVYRQLGLVYEDFDWTYAVRDAIGGISAFEPLRGEEGWVRMMLTATQAFLAHGDVVLEVVYHHASQPSVSDPCMTSF